MSLRINYSSSTMRALIAGNQASRAMSHSLEQLSSGLRINRASDDAASLSISESLRAQVLGRQRALANCQDFVSLLQLTDGALDQITNSLQRIRELAVQAANGTQDAGARSMIQAEVDGLVKAIDLVGSETTFNSQKLLDGSFVNKVAQVGANESETMTLSIGEMSASALGLTGSVTPLTPLSSLGITTGTVVIDWALGLALPSMTVNVNPGDTLGDFFNNVQGMTGFTGSIAGNVITFTGAWNFTHFGISGASTSNLGSVTNLSTGTFSGNVFPVNSTLTASAPISGGGLSVSSNADANQALSQVDAALAQVSAERGRLGAAQNRLESTIRNLAVSLENMTAAESRLRELDFAGAMTGITRSQILMESSSSILAQANLSSASLLRLLA